MNLFRVAYFEPEYDFTPVLEEWSKVAIRELDFKNEVENMTRIRENLLNTKLEVIVPQVEGNLYSNRVIVMEFCEGFKVTDTDLLDMYGIEREALLKRICQAYAHQVYIDGYFNCDPHPGQYNLFTTFSFVSLFVLSMSHMLSPIQILEYQRGLGLGHVRLFFK